MLKEDSNLSAIKFMTDALPLSMVSRYSFHYALLFVLNRHFGALEFS